jgi:hypothetical protein
MSSGKTLRLAGTVNAVNTAPFYPPDFDILCQIMVEVDGGEDSILHDR